MTGNFVSAAFDGQSAIIGRKRKAPPGPLGPDNAFIGQNPDTGFIHLAPWIEPDPGIANQSLTLGQRRALLAADGSKLLSGAPCASEFTVGACQNGYRESVIWSDLSLPDARTPGAIDPTRTKPPSFSWNVPVSDREDREHERRSHRPKRSHGRKDSDRFLPRSARSPQVAAVGSHVYVVWHETRGDRLPNAWLAVSRDGGRSFRKPVRVSANAEGSVEELHPSVAADQGQVVVAWQEFASARDDDRGRIELARFDPRGRKLSVERVDDSDLSGKWLPAVALSQGTPVVAWIDERDTGPDGEPLEHVYAARANDTGGGFGSSRRVDAGAPVALALHIDNKWAPTIAAAGAQVFLAWADFRNYNWEIFGARSNDGGRSWGTNVRIDDYLADERLNERPTVAFGANGALHAAWTDLRAREPDTNIFYARSADLGATFSPPRQLDDSRVGFNPDRDTPSNQWHPSLAAAGDRLFSAWQDNRLGNNDIFFSQSADGGTTFGASERVDDTGAGQSEQTRPRLTWADGTCYAAWEDDRNGASAIYLGRRSCPLP
jgi:hypothetical protein